MTLGSPAAWVGFVAFIVVMLALDLGVFHKKSHVVTVREAAGWSAAWFVLAIVFGAGVHHLHGAGPALEFATGYLIEKALAVDNIFVFVVIFSAFGIPTVHQHRVLFWGVLGALVMRAGFIFAGAALLQRFHFTIYVFGAILLATGVKLLFQKSDPDPDRSWLLRTLRRLVPMTRELHGERFTARVEGRLRATPLLAALIAVEVTDLIFAVDSIPAIFAVTRDPFIVFTSNIFAILGLRSLYFLLAGIIHRFAYLKYGLALVLVFVGAKMALVDIVKVPIVASLAVIAGILCASVIVSWLRPPPSVAPPAPAGAEG